MKWFFFWENSDFLDPWRIAGGHTDGSSAYGYDANRVETCYRCKTPVCMKWHVHRKYVFTFALCRCWWWTGQNWSFLVEFLSFRSSWLQSQMHRPSSTEAVVFTHPDVDHILGNQAGCHSTDWMRPDFLQMTSLCTYVQKTNRHKIQYSQYTNVQTSLD